MSRTADSVSVKADGVPARFRLLFVCTANICRSPMAAELAGLRVRSAAGPDAARRIVADSAGIHGFDGAGMDPRALAALRSLGALPTGFASRRLTAALVAEADLILTAERHHRAAAVALRPRAHATAFTILEFARLVRDVDPGGLPDDGVVARARALVRETAQLRGCAPPAAEPADDDITDPFGGPAEEFHTCAAIIDAALDRSLGLILRPLSRR
jgi:low molecular weight protein-tyrosine phosphatase